jgi:hypothetical protein
MKIIGQTLKICENDPDLSLKLSEAVKTNNDFKEWILKSIPIEAVNLISSLSVLTTTSLFDILSLYGVKHLGEKSSIDINVIDLYLTGLGFERQFGYRTLLTTNDIVNASFNLVKVKSYGGSIYLEQVKLFRQLEEVDAVSEHTKNTLANALAIAEANKIKQDQANDLLKHETVKPKSGDWQKQFYPVPEKQEIDPEETKRLTKVSGAWGIYWFFIGTFMFLLFISVCLSK